MPPFSRHGGLVLGTLQQSGLTTACIHGEPKVREGGLEGCGHRNSMHQSRKGFVINPVHLSCA